MTRYVTLIYLRHREVNLKIVLFERGLDELRAAIVLDKRVAVFDDVNEKEWIIPVEHILMVEAAAQLEKKS